MPNRSASERSFLFFLVKFHLIKLAKVIPSPAKTICKIMAIVYRGASLSGKK